MSLDVYLQIEPPHDPATREAILICREGRAVEISRQDWDDMHPGREPVVTTAAVNPGEPETVFEWNITHNLGRMAKAVGLYQHLWRPEEIDISYGRQLIDPLAAGLARLRADPAGARKHNPPNGWGSYEGLVELVGDYLDACRKYPDAKVRVSR